MCGFHPQPPWDRKWHFFVFLTEICLFHWKAVVFGTPSRISKLKYNLITTQWQHVGHLEVPSWPEVGSNPPFCDRFLTLCTKMPTTWGLMTHSNLYKDKTLDNRCPGSFLAYTGSHPLWPEVVQCDRKLSKNLCKIIFFTIWRPLRWPFSIPKLAY